MIRTSDIKKREDNSPFHLTSFPQQSALILYQNSVKRVSLLFLLSIIDLIIMVRTLLVNYQERYKETQLTEIVP